MYRDVGLFMFEYILVQGSYTQIQHVIQGLHLSGVDSR